MTHRLRLAENRVRYREQADRDENMVTGSVSRNEFDDAILKCEKLKAHIVELSDELEKKSQLAQSLYVENSQLKAMMTSVEKSKYNSSQRAEDLEKIEDQYSLRLKIVTDEYELKIWNMEKVRDDDTKALKLRIDDLTDQLKTKEALVKQWHDQAVSGSSKDGGSSDKKGGDNKARQQLAETTQLIAQLDDTKGQLREMSRDRDMYFRAFEQMTAGAQRFLDPWKRFHLA